VDFLRTLRFAAIVIAAQSAWGQAAPSFEVASIHRNRGGSQNTQIDTSDAGRLTITNASLKTLIRNAYGVLSFQLADEPAWLDTEMYDIQATTGTAEQISPESLKPLLQSLIAERFALKVHWETRESTVYALLVDKGGPKFHASTGEQANMDTQKGPERVAMKGTAQTMAVLTSNLGNQLGRFAVDKTGLSGVWDFTLSWDRQTTADSTGPSLFTALREQLGLRLEAQKGPVQILVIDRADHASEN
jgi:uncharacterized protein (TIGR03435 family)